MTKLLEGQLAFLSHIPLYEQNHPGTHLLQRNLIWKYEFLCCFLGRLSVESLDELAREIHEVAYLRHDHGSWAVRQSKALSGILRHNERTQLGTYMDVSLEDLQRLKTRPLRSSFSFLMANSKGRFKNWVWSSIASSIGTSTLGSVPSRDTAGCLNRFSEAAMGERLTLERCHQLGMIFHA